MVRYMFLILMNFEIVLYLNLICVNYYIEDIYFINFGISYYCFNNYLVMMF